MSFVRVRAKRTVAIPLRRGEVATVGDEQFRAIRHGVECLADPSSPQTDSTDSEPSAPVGIPRTEADWYAIRAKTEVMIGLRGDVSVARRAARNLGRVGWVHDSIRRDGGAELSNARVVEVGRSLGLTVDELGPAQIETWEGPMPWDVLIINGTRALSDNATRTVESWCVESRIPFVLYEHDYQFCRRRNGILCDGALDGRCPRVEGNALCHDAPAQGDRPLLAWRRRMASHAALCVFLSPRHREINERAYGPFPRVHLIPSPIDPERYAAVPGVPREADLAVCIAGHLSPHKGKTAVFAWAVAHPEIRVEVYVEPDETHADAPPNVTVRPKIPAAEIPRLLSRAGVVLFFPAGPEPGGRTVAEAALCGARVEANDRVGFLSFEGVPMDDADTLRDWLASAPFDFWRAVEGAVGAHRWM